MNTEYVWWFLALLLASGGMVAFLALGRVPKIEDEPAEEPTEEPTGPDQDVDQAAPGDAPETPSPQAPTARR